MPISLILIFSSSFIGSCQEYPEWDGGDVQLSDGDTSNTTDNNQLDLDGELSDAQALTAIAVLSLVLLIAVIVRNGRSK